MSYKLDFSIEALADLRRLNKNEPQVYKKAMKLIAELYVHPQEGLGRPKQLTGNMRGFWSRRITDKHRLVYKIENEVLTVLVLSAHGHYGDK